MTTRVTRHTSVTPVSFSLSNQEVLFKNVGATSYPEYDVDLTSNISTIAFWDVNESGGEKK